MQYNYKSINELLTVHGIKMSKSMGQNFLVDANIPRKIVEGAGISGSSGVLEVGPGLGALTSELASKINHVTAVELDKRLIPILQNIFTDTENVTIVQGDILKLDIKNLVEKTMPGLTLHVCANLPYNITTPAVTAFIESEIFTSVTVMIQKEVAQRICAKPGSPEYGAFTVYANYHTIPRILFDVPPECFTPRPKVISSVICLKIKTDKYLNPEEEKLFFRIVRASFQQRRKTLVNSLYASFASEYNKEDIADIISKCGFDTKIRGEKLSPDEFIELSKHFNNL